MEKIIQIIKGDRDEKIYLTSEGRVLRYKRIYPSMYVGMDIGTIKEIFEDITPDLTKFKK